MPVRWRSRSSMAASAWRPLGLSSRSSSSSASTPARMTPPSARVTGGSSTRVWTDHFVQVFEGVEALASGSIAAIEVLGRLQQTGKAAQSCAERDDFAGPGGVQRDAAEQAFEIENTVHGAAQRFALAEVGRGSATASRRASIRRDRWTGAAAARAADACPWACSRRRACRRGWSAELAGEQWVDQFEVADGDRVEFEAGGALVEAQGVEVLELALLGGAQVVDQSARRRWQRPRGRRGRGRRASGREVLAAEAERSRQ